MFWKLLLHGIQFSSGVSPTFAVIIIQCKPPSVPRLFSVHRPEMTRYEARIKQAPWILCGVREGSAGEAGGGRGRDRMNEKKEGGETIVVSCPGSDS